MSEYREENGKDHVYAASDKENLGPKKPTAKKRRDISACSINNIMIDILKYINTV